MVGIQKIKGYSLDVGRVANSKKSRKRKKKSFPWPELDGKEEAKDSEPKKKKKVCGKRKRGGKLDITA